MAGSLDRSAGPGTYIQRSRRFFLDKGICGHQVVEDPVCVEEMEWVIGADTFRAHLEHLRQLQRNGHEDIRISEGADGIVTVERRLDHRRCRVITTYTPEGVEAPTGAAEDEPRNDYLRLLYMVKRIRERNEHFE